MNPVNKLKTTTLGNLTQTQLHDTASSTFVNRPAPLKNALEIHNAKLAISTFGGNGVIPDSGAIEEVTFTDGPPTGVPIQPSAGEVWRVDLCEAWIVNGSGGSNDVTLMWTDGIMAGTYITATIAGAATNGKLFDVSATPSSVHTLTNALYLAVVGTQSVGSTLNVPYTLVAM